MFKITEKAYPLSEKETSHSSKRSSNNEERNHNLVLKRGGFTESVQFI